MDLLIDCVFVKVVKLVPFNVLPLIVYVITNESVPFAVDEWSAIVQNPVVNDAAPSVILAVLPTDTVNCPLAGVPVTNGNAVAPSKHLIVVPLPPCDDTTPAAFACNRWASFDKTAEIFPLPSSSCLNVTLSAILPSSETAV